MSITQRESVVAFPFYHAEIQGTTATCGGAMQLFSSVNALATANNPQLLRATWAYIKANTDNAGNVYIGLSSAVTKQAGTTSITGGLPIYAGQGEMIPCPAQDPTRLFYVCDNVGDDFSVTLYR